MLSHQTLYLAPKSRAAGAPASRKRDEFEVILLSFPYWTQCQKLAKKILAVFPQKNFAGIGIAITDTVPPIIKLNVDPDGRLATRLDVRRDNLVATFDPRNHENSRS